MADITNVETLISTDVYDQLLEYFEIPDDDELSQQKLALIIYMAEQKVVKKRFPFGYSDEDKETAIGDYKDIVLQCAMRDFARVGAEGESSHEENGISRDYVTDDELFSNIIPMCKVI